MVRIGAARRVPTYFLYGEAPRPLSGPLLHVETIRERSARHQWRIDPHVHRALHQVVVVLRGTGVALLDGVQSRYRAPALILVPARTAHGFEFEPGTAGHVVSVSEELLHDMAQSDPGVAALFVRPGLMELDGPELRATDLALSVRMLAREFPGADRGHRLALNGWLQVLLGNVLRFALRQASPGDPAVGPERRLLEKYFTLIDQCFRSGQKVEQYATALHVSPSRLRRLCLALTGQSPMQLVHARIMLEARRLLHCTDRAVHVIATELGFEDAAYFTRFFSRRAGVSPRVFRQRGPERISAQEPPAP